jgi:WD40 repeat protein
MDKTDQVVVWRLTDDCDGASPCDAATAPARLAAHACAGPVFALAVDAAGAAAAASAGDGAPPAGGRPHVFWGGADGAVRASAPPLPAPLPFALDGHPGWVRALAASGRWLFSAGCGEVNQWDLARARPRLVSSAALARSDVACLTATADAVYAGGADGSLTRWPLVAGGGIDAASATVLPAAHAGRVAALALHPVSGALLTVSHDGSVSAWDPATLEKVAHTVSAHGGGAARALAVGADGLVYTGGDDGRVSRWRGADLAPASGGPLHGHSAPVRALAAGEGGVLASGDKRGEVCVWLL